MALFRKFVFWLHLACGIAAGVVIFIMAVTGVLLTFERQVTDWADTRGLPVSAKSGTAMPLADVVAKVEQAEGAAATAIAVRLDKPGLLQVSFGRQKTVFVDAATGEVLGAGAKGVRAFFRWTTDLHRWLALSGEHRTWGKAVTGASNLIFLFLVCSGFYLWFPRKWNLRAFLNVALLRRGLSGKAREFNWHNAIGFWSALPLAVIVAAGVVISYPWASNLVYKIAGEAPPARRGGGEPSRAGGGAEQGGGRGEGAGRSLPFELLVEKAQKTRNDLRSVTVQLDGHGEDVTVTADAGNGRQPQKRTKLTFSNDGTLLKSEPFSAGSAGTRARSIFRFAHTGEIGGIVGQSVAGLASAGAVFLVYTGWALSWRRWRARSRV